ncbi:MAG: CBS domain-containing protein [Anaerolineae bacterium]
MQVILTHENADFDALAALLAAWKLFPQAKPVLPRRLNRNLRDFLTLYWDELPFVQPEDLPRETVDLALVVDTQSYAQVRGMGPRTRVHIVDHHAPPETLPPGTTFRGEPVGATTTLLVEEILQRGLSLTGVEATLLALGIYEDTGGFSYSSTTPRDLRCAAWLLEQGANLDVVNDFLHYPLTRAQQALYQALVEASEPYEFAGHTVILAAASVRDFDEEISTLAHKVQDLLDPDALFVLVDLGDFVQMVARSRTEDIHVGRVAEEFGGGGHARAAAALIRGLTLQEIRERLLQVLPQHVRPPVTVRQIMSFGVHTISPQTTVAEAAEVMLRYGHEGFPVVEEGHVVGVVTRREIDKALHHKLGRKRVEEILIKGPIAVRPDDSIETLQAVMMERGVGQVPVVEHGQVIGIVTRTDLLKLWSRPRQPSPSAQHTVRLMEEALSPQVVTLLREVGRQAREMGFSIYAVGGVVRDLLLGIPNLDLDLVVEGDAIALARVLARSHGGRVRSHRRFGTAKWILEAPMKPFQTDQGEVDWGTLPIRHLDFVTARTEFYEHPTALPQVERSSIRQDLHRRDFTINTLAIALAPERFGELLDFYGGHQDLRQGLIRVLHSLSFVEDPTRMLRAVRLEQRLGFRIEERTAELMENALDLLRRTTGERIRHELYLILEEAEPEKALVRLDELGILRALSPGLQGDAWLAERCRALRQSVQEEPWASLAASEPICGASLAPCYLALLTYRLEPVELDRFAERLRIVRDDRRLLKEMADLRPVLAQLRENHLRPSQIYALLTPFSPRARFLAWLVEEAWLVRQRLELFERRLRHVQPAIDGEYLRKELQVEPGPIYRRILSRLRAARLDSEVHTLEEERALALQVIRESEAEHGGTHGGTRNPDL